MRAGGVLPFHSRSTPRTAVMSGTALWKSKVIPTAPTPAQGSLIPETFFWGIVVWAEKRLYIVRIPRAKSLQ